MHKTSEWLLSFKTENGQSPLKSQLAIENFKPCSKISITGGKGGVGKTSIALKTAKELAQAGFRTLLVDCDSNLSNTAIKLGLPLDNKFEKLLSAEITFEECLIQQGKLHLLPACNGSLEIFENKLKLDEIIMDIITSHEHEYDYILLDCPAGLSREALTLNAFCDYRFIIVTPDKSSITDSYSLMKVLSQKFNVKENHVIVNMYTSDKQLYKVISTLTETTMSFLGVAAHFLGGIRRLDVPSESFDTFFLSDLKNDCHKNFIKLLYAFTEKAGGSTAREHRLTPDAH
ncbi:MAG TPA: AAA family ATPase [Bacteriovoracaceae bacterium]|nr:AAA family ATPase [Bacteriovoracaceae bacterium]